MVTCFGLSRKVETLRSHFFLELPWAFREAFQLELLPTFQVWTKVGKEMGHWLISEIEKAIGNDIKCSPEVFLFLFSFLSFFRPLGRNEGCFPTKFEKTIFVIYLII